MIKRERLITTTAARRRKIVENIELFIYMIKYGIILCILSGIVNFILDCFGIGIIY